MIRIGLSRRDARNVDTQLFTVHDMAFFIHLPGKMYADPGADRNMMLYMVTYSKPFVSGASLHPLAALPFMDGL